MRFVTFGSATRPRLGLVQSKNLFTMLDMVMISQGDMDGVFAEKPVPPGQEKVQLTWPS